MASGSFTSTYLMIAIAWISRQSAAMINPRRWSFIWSAFAWFAVALATHVAQAQQAAPVDAQAPAAQPRFQPSGDWEKLPKMQLERQFAGPLRDTVIQRLRDPVDGSICYIYLPISAPHSPAQSNGFVQYGGNTIGSINCLPAPSPQKATSPAARKQ